MRLLARLLGKRRGQSAARGEQSAPEIRRPEQAHGTLRVSYDPGLIGRLLNDHRELLRTYGAVKTAAADSRFGDVHRLLSHLRYTFQAHTATEHGRFLRYLQHRVASNEEASRLVTEALGEMDELAFEILKLVDGYIAHPPSHLNEAQFKYDLEQAGSLLARRIKKSETQLYPLYRP